MRRILRACEKTPRKQDKTLVASVSSKAGDCYWNAFLCLSQGQQIEGGVVPMTHCHMLLLQPELIGMLFYDLTCINGLML